MVTGFSQGGVLSYTLAATRADVIVAAVPIAGVYPTALPEPQRRRGALKLRAFHGTSDARMPFADAERSVARFTARGVDARLASFPGVGHSVSAQMREQIYVTLHELLTQ